MDKRVGVQAMIFGVGGEGNRKLIHSHFVSIMIQNFKKRNESHPIRKTCNNPPPVYLGPGVAPLKCNYPPPSSPAPNLHCLHSEDVSRVPFGNIAYFYLPIYLSFHLCICCCRGLWKKEQMYLGSHTIFTNMSNFCIFKFLQKMRENF